MPVYRKLSLRKLNIETSDEKSKFKTKDLPSWRSPNAQLLFPDPIHETRQSQRAKSELSLHAVGFLSSEYSIFHLCLLPPVPRSYPFYVVGKL